MKNIKPSQDLIDKTIKLAHEEQQRLNESKEKKDTRLIYNLNFKKYSALAFTMLLAVFAVKLWSGLSLNEIPSIEVTDTTTTSETTESISTDDNIDNNTTSSNQIDNITDVTSIYSESTQVIDTLTYPSSEYINNISTVPSIDYTTESVTNNEEFITTTVPDDIINPTDNQHTNTTVPSDNNIFDSSNKVTINTGTTTSVPVSSFTTMTTKKDNNITTTFTTMMTNSTTKNTTTIISNNADVSNNANAEASNSINNSETDESMDCATTTIPAIEVTTNVEPNIPDYEPGEATLPVTTYDSNGEEGDIPVTATSNIANSDVSSGGNGDIDVTITNTTEEETMTSSYPYLVFKVELYNIYNGFYYNGVLYTGRIKERLSFGDAITYGTSIGTTSSGNCEYILFLDYYKLSNILGNKSIAEYTTYITEELNGDYSTTENYTNYTELFCSNQNLDINNNGIGIDSDLDDRSTILDLISLDD